MKSKLFLGLACLGIIFAACQNKEEIEQPSGLEGSQMGSHIELTWNAVENAVSYDISRNGDYLASSRTNRYVDENPNEGENLYEVLAFDGTHFSKAASIRVFFEKPSGGGDDNGGDDNGGGNGGDEVADYYIKHPWGTGADADWSWKPMMTQSAGTYVYEGQWGGVGANINTVADDNNAKWFPSSSINGASGVSLGDNVRFTYQASSSSLSVTKISGGGGGNATADYYIKHPWGTGADADWSWKPMEKSGNRYAYVGAWGAKGININTKPEDASAVYYPLENSNYSLGTLIKFEYEPSTKIVYTTPQNNGGGDNPGGGGSVILPSAPTGLEARAYEGYINISWVESKDADSYNVYRKIYGSKDYNCIKKGVKGFTYKDYSISPNTKYTYTVSSVNTSGETPLSSCYEVSVESLSSGGGSGGDDNGGGSGGDNGGGSGGGGGSTNYSPCPPKVTCSGTSSVNVSWQPEVGTGCGTPKKYDVKRMNLITNSYETLKEGTTSTSYNDSQPFPGKNTYAIVAANDEGTAYGTAFSNAVSIAAPSISGSIYASTHALDITVKDLNVPDDWKPSYSLQLLKSTSSSGQFSVLHEWKYDDTVAKLTYEFEYPSSMDLRGESYYIKLRWVFNPNNTIGKETSAQKVTHK